MKCHVMAFNDQITPFFFPCPVPAVDVLKTSQRKGAVILTVSDQFGGSLTLHSGQQPKT